MKEEKVILDTDTQAARFIENIKGWVDINNRFYGNNEDSERMARYSSATHRTCECGKIMVKGYTKCEECRAKAERERYNELPFQEWDEKTPVYSHYFDKYFFSPSEIEDAIDEEKEEYDVAGVDLMLVLCIPNKYFQVGSDHWCDIMADDDMDDDDPFPKELKSALETLNNVIEKLPPASWSPGKIRTEYKVSNN